MILASVLLATLGAQCNSPYPASEEGQNILYGSLIDEPKHLDPAQSYATNESELICQTIEPPFQYHFLKRPYEIEPLTVEAIPRPEQRNVQFGGKTVEATVYTFKVKKGIRYHDHPCFVPSNLKLKPADVRGVRDVWDIRPYGTRELVAGDFVYATRRLADPRLACPVYPTLAENLVGMEEYQQSVKDQLEQVRDVRRAAAGALYSQEADEKFNPIPIDFSAGAKEFPFVREIDRYTFEIVLRQPYPQILYWMTMSFFAPVPPEAIAFFNQRAVLEKSIFFDFNPVGTGPYVMREFDPVNQIVFERNPYFREEHYPTLPLPPDNDPVAKANYQRMKEAGMLEDAGKLLPMADKIVLRLEKESIPRWNKFLQGYIDYESTEHRYQELFGEAVTLSSRGDLLLSDEMAGRGIRMVSAYPTSNTYYAFNMNDPLVGGLTPEKRKLRLAISIAFDTEARIAIFGNGQGQPAMGPIAPGIFGYEEGKDAINPKVFQWDEARQKPVRRSIEEAKKLLAEAGYPNGYGPDGQPLAFRFITTGTRATDQARTDFMKKQFAKLNIRLIVETTDYNRFQDKVKNGNYQFLDWGWVADYPDPENFLALLYGPNAKVVSGGENVANYQNPKYDELFVKMRYMENGPERLAIIRQMIDVLRDDAPWIFGEHIAEFVIHHDYFHNAFPHAIGFNTLKYKRIEPDKRARYRAAFNQPKWWPVLVMLGAVLVAGAPAVRATLRRMKGAHA